MIYQLIDSQNKLDLRNYETEYLIYFHYFSVSIKLIKFLNALHLQFVLNVVSNVIVVIGGNYQYM